MLAPFTLLFIAVPVVGAWSLEFDRFIIMFMLFCVVGGLCSPQQQPEAAETTRDGNADLVPDSPRL